MSENVIVSIEKRRKIGRSRNFKVTLEPFCTTTKEGQADLLALLNRTVYSSSDKRAVVSDLPHYHDAEAYDDQVVSKKREAALLNRAKLLNKLSAEDRAILADIDTDTDDTVAETEEVSDEDATDAAAEVTAELAVNVA